MLMPRKIDNIMFAPCGLDCMLCRGHLLRKKSCPGCLGSDENKSPSCISCAIKICAKEKGLTYCYECGEFPCKQVKNINKRYETKYHTKLIENLLYAKDKGVEAFLAMDKKRWTCGECGGVICVHDDECTECHTKLIR